MATTARTYRTEAIIVRRTDFGEADRIVTLYTASYGKVRAVARGVRRPRSKLGGSLELFSHTEAQLARGRDLDIITQAEIVRAYHHLRDDLWRTSLACYAAELVDRLNEVQQPNPPLFALLLDTLGYLDEGGPAEALVMRRFETQLLGLLGYLPELYHCTACSARLQPSRLYYSEASGGALCSDCGPGQQRARPVSVSAIKTLRLLAQKSLDVAARLQVSAATAAEVEELLQASVTYILERRPRAAEFLARLKADGLAPAAAHSR